MPSGEEKIYYITKSLDEQQVQIKDLYNLHHNCSKDVGIQLGKLDVKSGIWYALAGAIPGVAAILILLFKGLL
jgi:hypothetical protein